MIKNMIDMRNETKNYSNINSNLFIQVLLKDVL